MLDYSSTLRAILEKNGVGQTDIGRYLFTYYGLLAVSRNCTPKQAYETVLGEYNFHIKSQKDRERTKLHPVGV